jgi:hypothetical protein
MLVFEPAGGLTWHKPSDFLTIDKSELCAASAPVSDWYMLPRRALPAPILIATPLHQSLTWCTSAGNEQIRATAISSRDRQSKQLIIASG